MPVATCPLPCTPVATYPIARQTGGVVRVVVLQGPGARRTAPTSLGGGNFPVIALLTRGRVETVFSLRGRGEGLGRATSRSPVERKKR